MAARIRVKRDRAADRVNSVGPRELHAIGDEVVVRERALDRPCPLQVRLERERGVVLHEAVMEEAREGHRGGSGGLLEADACAVRAGSAELELAPGPRRRSERENHECLQHGPPVSRPIVPAPESPSERVYTSLSGAGRGGHGAGGEWREPFRREGLQLGFAAVPPLSGREVLARVLDRA